MKKFKTFLLLMLILPLAFVFSACSFGTVYVTGIEKIADDGTISTYCVTYSNGTTSSFTVENGENGKDGEDVKINDIFLECVARGLYQNTNEDFKKFLKDYLSIEIENNDVVSATNNALCSAVAVYSNFRINIASGSIRYPTIKKTNSLVGGSGVIYKMDESSEDAYSYIVTNYHVVYDVTCNTKTDHIANEIYIIQYGSTCYIDADDNATDELGYSPKTIVEGTYLTAEYVAGSMVYDLAVLRVKTKDLKEINPKAKQVTLASEYSVGDTAIAVGNPKLLGISATKGIVSVYSEYLAMTALDYSGDIAFREMRIDTAINGGNSGGGLFNINGELIGIVNAKATRTDIENISFAIPVDNVSRVVSNLIYYYENENLSYGKWVDLGLTTYTNNGKFVYEDGNLQLIEDTVIHSVIENGLAESINLRAGDIITAVEINGNKHEITLEFMLEECMLDARVGDEVRIHFTREGIANSAYFEVETNYVYRIK